MVTSLQPTELSAAARAALRLLAVTRMGLEPRRIQTQSQMMTVVTVGWPTRRCQEGDALPKYVFSTILMCGCRVCVYNPCEVGIEKFGDVPMADQACCRRGIDPSSELMSVWPTCGDKQGGLRLPNPDPVTSEECGENYVYNPATATRCVLAVIASVPCNSICAFQKLPSCPVCSGE